MKAMKSTTATEAMSMELNDGANQYLTFVLGGEEYAVDILKVREIRGWESVTRIPNTPDYVLGVINLRGTVVPIIDLRRRFALDNADFGPTTVVIVISVEHGGKARTVGMVVDAVSEVYNIEKNMINPAPDIGGAISIDFIKGLVTIDGKMLILLEIDELVNTGVLQDINADNATD